MQKILKKYNEKLNEIKRITAIDGLLQWDQETEMPVKAITERSEESALISKLAHEKFIDPEFGDLINELYENRSELSAIEKRSIEVQKKDYDRITKLPAKFVAEFSKQKSLSQAAWVEAKTTENYKVFQPYLKKMIKYSRDYAQYIDATKPIYDVLLDDYEEGMTTPKLQQIFSDLKVELVELLTKIPKTQDRHSLSGHKFNKAITKDFLIAMTKKIGFDYERGTIGEVHHPFETTLSENDIRINVAYPENNIGYSITSAIHELGHGLYEQNIAPKYFDGYLNHGVSLGIHESQSRLLENMIGRSQAFWKYFLPELKKYYPKLEAVTTDDVVNDLNRVEPSFIRTESDEVTYNLHIILRFEIELLLMNEELSTEDLPQMWNTKMHELFGIKPKKLSEGCLQDVHWSMGGIGYFPTYSLGNLNAGQLWHKFELENKNWQADVAKGDFSSYFEWFKKNIWQHGAYFKPAELLINTTGEDLNAKYFVDYLKTKYIK